MKLAWPLLLIFDLVLLRFVAIGLLQRVRLERRLACGGVCRSLDGPGDSKNGLDIEVALQPRARFQLFLGFGTLLQNASIDGDLLEVLGTRESLRTEVLQVDGGVGSVVDLAQKVVEGDLVLGACLWRVVDSIEMISWNQPVEPMLSGNSRSVKSSQAIWGDAGGIADFGYSRSLVLVKDCR